MLAILSTPGPAGLGHPSRQPLRAAAVLPQATGLIHATPTGMAKLPGLPLDAALLRPGRLDELVYVGTPDAPGRAHILKIHTKQMPLAADVDLHFAEHPWPSHRLTCVHYTRWPTEKPRR